MKPFPVLTLPWNLARQFRTKWRVFSCRLIWTVPATKPCFAKVRVRLSAPALTSCPAPAWNSICRMTARHAFPPKAACWLQPEMFPCSIPARCSITPSACAMAQLKTMPARCIPGSWTTTGKQTSKWICPDSASMTIRSGWPIFPLLNRPWMNCMSSCLIPMSWSCAEQTVTDCKLSKVRCKMVHNPYRYSLLPPPAGGGYSDPDTHTSGMRTVVSARWSRMISKTRGKVSAVSGEPTCTPKAKTVSTGNLQMTRLSIRVELYGATALLPIRPTVSVHGFCRTGKGLLLICFLPQEMVPHRTGFQERRIWWFPCRVHKSEPCRQIFFLQSSALISNVNRQHTALYIFGNCTKYRITPSLNKGNIAIQSADTASKVRQLPERCLSRQAGIVRCCLKLNSNAKPTKCRRISFIWHKTQEKTIYALYYSERRSNGASIFFRCAADESGGKESYAVSLAGQPTILVGSKSYNFSICSQTDKRVLSLQRQVLSYADSWFWTQFGFFCFWAAGILCCLPAGKQSETLQYVSFWSATTDIL